MQSFDVLVIGAGPTGLACAIDAQRAGLRVVSVDKGCLCNSLFHYPANMTFFTTPELLEIGDIPFPTENHRKPTRGEALEYYRRVTEHYRLDVRQYCRVERVSGRDGNFVVHTRNRLNEPLDFGARKLIVATGFYDLPNLMNVAGEELPKVKHYYDEPHPYFGCDVVIVGAKNSAAIAALELWRHGARVTIVHRGPGIHQNVKYWIKPDLENRIRNGEIAAFFNTAVREITPAAIVLNTREGERTLPNDFVLALTGYHPDFGFLRDLGVELTPPECRPRVDTNTLETNVPGIYLAGVVIAGTKTGEIFIENGRFHGRQIAADLRRKLQPEQPTEKENSAS
jgi:thioredoxin reductase (NADPH)